MLNFPEGVTECGWFGCRSPAGACVAVYDIPHALSPGHESQRAPRGPVVVSGTVPGVGVESALVPPSHHGTCRMLGQTLFFVTFFYSIYMDITKVQQHIFVHTLSLDSDNKKFLKKEKI